MKKKHAEVKLSWYQNSSTLNSAMILFEDDDDDGGDDNSIFIAHPITLVLTESLFKNNF